MLFFELFPGIRRTTESSEAAKWRARYLSEKNPPYMFQSVQDNLCTFTTYIELVAHDKSYHLRLALRRRLNLQLGSYTFSCKPRFNLKFVSKRFPNEIVSLTWCIGIVCTNEADDEQLKRGGQPKATAKAKGKAKAKAKPAPASMNSVDPKRDRSPQKPDQPSPNPIPSKRMKGKQGADDPMKTIQALQEAS